MTEPSAKPRYIARSFMDYRWGGLRWYVWDAVNRAELNGIYTSDAKAREEARRRCSLHVRSGS
jgi:hypothetical protein